jgi:hypothetical protein
MENYDFTKWEASSPDCYTVLWVLAAMWVGIIIFQQIRKMIK